MYNLIFRIIIGCGIILNLLGFLLNTTGIYETGKYGYFSYDLRFLLHFPYWVFANITLFAATLIVGLYFSGARIHMTSGHRKNIGKPAVIILGINLILILALLALFPAVSSEKSACNDLLKKRIVYLAGDITGDEVERITSAILQLNAQNDSKEITLYIDSDGGSVLAGLHIYDAVKHSKSPVTGVVLKSASSMAVIVLQACKTRRALKHSHIFIHNIKITDEWHKFEENLGKELKDVKVLQQNINGLLAERAGTSVEEIQELTRRGTVLKPEEAKRLGLIDDVI